MSSNALLWALSGRDKMIGEQKRSNIHVKCGTSEDEFVKMRSERDATLSMPKLILPSVQINIRAGDMPPPEDNGQSYLKVPINRLIVTSTIPHS